MKLKGIIQVENAQQKELDNVVSHKTIHGQKIGRFSLIVTKEK